MLTPFQSRAQRALTATPFFQALGVDRMRWLTRTSVRKGEILFEKGAPSERLYGLMQGRLKLFSPGAGGREVALDLIAPGELLGALGMADGAPRYATALALENSELATIERRHLELLMDRHPELRSALFLASGEVGRRLARRLEDAAFLGIEQRIEKALVDLAHRVGERIAGGTKIRLRQQDLADLLGLSRESVNKVLTSPAMRHRLELGRGSIVLVGR